MVVPFFVHGLGDSIHLLESPKKQAKVKCQRKDGDESFVLFHIKRVAIGFVRHSINAKSHAIRVPEYVINF
jgi:hypothetical protein